jgi:hypothetical protein
MLLNGRVVGKISLPRTQIRLWPCCGRIVGHPDITRSSNLNFGPSRLKNGLCGKFITRLFRKFGERLLAAKLCHRPPALPQQPSPGKAMKITRSTTSPSPVSTALLALKPVLPLRLHRSAVALTSDSCHHSAHCSSNTPMSSI